MEEHPNPVPPPDPASWPENPFVRVPDHELIRLIGRGSYGEVWLAKNSLGTYRAIKIVYARTFRHKRPFEREFNGVQKFEPVSRLHDGLMDILQVGRNDAEGYFYCVMELADDVVSGQKIDPETYCPRTLTRDVAAHQRLPFAECRRLGIAIASALEFLHARGLIHRDVKPSNIVFVNGVPKLADIGLVAEKSEARSYVGTEGFIPPEGPGTVQADIYSFGKVLYEISTGKDRHDYPDLPTHLGDPLQEEQMFELNKIILKACRTDPRQRYKSAGMMVDDLLSMGGDHSRPFKRIARRYAIAIATAVAAVCVTVAGGLAWFRAAPAAGPSAVIAPQGLTGWWKGEGNSDDSAGNSPVTRLDGVGFKPARVGLGFEFDGGKHYVTISNAAALNFSSNQDFSIEAWVQPQTASTNTQYGFMPIVNKVSSPRETEFLGYELTLVRGRIHFAMSDNLGSFANLVIDGGPDLRDGAFHHIAVTVQRNSRTGGVIYVDGNPEMTFDPTTEAGDLSNTEPARIGCHPCPDIEAFYKGIIDELSIYRRALSEAEVQAVCKAGSVGKTNVNLNLSSFARRIDVATGSGPNQTSVADMDADGSRDIVVANMFAHTISIHRMLKRPGSFSARSLELPFQLSTGEGTVYKQTAADLDGDNRPEVIATDTARKAILIFKNISVAGKLNFEPPVILALKGTPMNSLVVQDLDGDHRADIAVSDDKGTVSIFHNQCKPGEIKPESFGARIDRSFEMLADVMIAGDLDGDHKPELIFSGMHGTHIAILRNGSTPGTLDAASFGRAPELVPAPEGPMALGVEDLDRDGRADLITGATNRMLSIYQNITPASPAPLRFAPKIEFAATGWVQSIGFGDLNEDGKPEVIVTCQSESQLSVFQNFSEPSSLALGQRLDFATGENAAGLTVADVDGDDRVDCIFGNAYSGSIAIYPNRAARARRAGTLSSVR